MSKIYKYFHNSLLEKVFLKTGHCSIKCSHPEDYNDPFELFLSVDLTASSELLAFYNDVVQEISQIPTTCFSTSPLVTPMWAHYANNQSGFVLEFDVDSISKAHEDTFVKEVSYRNSPNENLLPLLEHAAGTKKMRHSDKLVRAAMHTAYFSKLKEWSYEQEVRLVTPHKNIEVMDGNQILHLPITAVSAIISGSNCSDELMQDCMSVAKKNDLDWYNLIIPKSSMSPYMKDEKGNTHTFSKSRISIADTICESCQEPITDSEDKCPWCRITDSQKSAAAAYNPLRILESYGLLEDYIAGTDKIRKKR